MTKTKVITNFEEYIQALMEARKTEKDPVVRARIKEALFFVAYGNGPVSIQKLEIPEPKKLSNY